MIARRPRKELNERMRETECENKLEVKLRRKLSSGKGSGSNFIAFFFFNFTLLDDIVT